MDVKRCDRCGKIYDCNTALALIRYKTPNNYDNDCGTSTYDLCDTCDKEFQVWLKGREKEE